MYFQNSNVFRHCQWVTLLVCASRSRTKRHPSGNPASLHRVLHRVVQPPPGSRKVIPTRCESRSQTKPHPSAEKVSKPNVLLRPPLRPLGSPRAIPRTCENQSRIRLRPSVKRASRRRAHPRRPPPPPPESQWAMPRGCESQSQTTHRHSEKLVSSDKDVRLIIFFPKSWVTKWQFGPPYRSVLNYLIGMH
jgi:hypothetical protein